MDKLKRVKCDCPSCTKTGMENGVVYYCKVSNFYMGTGDSYKNIADYLLNNMEINNQQINKLNDKI
jgi:hypothetical protein